MSRIPFTVLAGAFTSALFCVAAPAQRLIAYDPFGPLVTELQPPDAVLPVPNPPLVTYPAAPMLPPPAGAFPVPSDSTFDNITGLHWFTNGAVLAAMPTPTFPPVGPVPPPLPIPAAVMGAIGGPITGIAIDPAAGVMWLSSLPGIVIGVAPVAGMPVVVPPFPIAAPVAPIAGLEWDGLSGTLFAVDITGTAWNFLPGGPLVAPPIVPVVPLPGPPGDIAIDKMMRINPVGLRPLYVTAGGMVADITDPGALPFPSGPLAEGLAFVNHPLQVGPLGMCASCPTVPGVFANVASGPATSGNGAYAIGLTGMAPGSLCVFGFDSVYNPLFPTVNVVGCPLGLTLSPTLLLFPAITGAGGTAMFPLSLAGVPVGVTLYNQGFTLCPADPTGFVFSPFQSITVGGL